jgi:HTH-type transcriptional regulator/antitoxin HigA
MKQHDLRQVDLMPVFGSRSVASNVINGKRELSKAHIRKLAAFFSRVARSLLLKASRPRAAPLTPPETLPATSPR